MISSNEHLRSEMTGIKLLKKKKKFLIKIKLLKEI
jgi:hypothetical protein